LFNNTSDITTKEILKRYGDIGSLGGQKHTVETVEVPVGKTSKEGGTRPLAPVVTRVDTDPYQAHARQKESSVRHIQETSGSFGPGQSSSNQNTPPQQHWQGQELEAPAPFIRRTSTPDSQNEGHRNRDWRNSGWGRQQNGSLGVTGTS
jgi:hypothetical protein